MNWNMELISWGGHRYDPRVLAAPMESVVARSQIDQARKADRDIGLLGLHYLEVSEILLARERNVHLATERRPDGTPCACGLVVPDGVALNRASGHLDLRTWNLAGVLVVAESDGAAPWGAEYVGCRAYCQACGWLDDTRERADAARTASVHRCDGTPS